MTKLSNASNEAHRRPQHLLQTCTPPQWETCVDRATVVKSTSNKGMNKNSSSDKGKTAGDYTQLAQLVKAVKGNLINVHRQSKPLIKATYRTGKAKPRKLGYKS